MILLIFLVLSLMANFALGFVIWRFSRKLLQFDEIFETLANDIDVNTRFFEKLLGTPLFDNAPEVRTANNNMSIISRRLDEFVKQMEETSGKKLRLEKSSNPPVVR